MQTETIDMKDAQDHFKDLVGRAASGIHIIISEGQHPIAHLLPAGTRTAGLNQGAMTTSPDFDEPLPDAFWTGGM